MLRDHVVSLISKVYADPDALGQLLPQETSREVFCRVGRVSQTEWFNAGRAGLAAQYKLVLFAPDYRGEDTVELDGERYGVYRNYAGDGDQIELYLERKGGL